MRFDLLANETLYRGFFSLQRYRLRFEYFDGSWSEPIEREIFERGHAVAVLPYDPERGEVVLIEQFRPGALDAPTGPWLAEIVAGMVEPGESAEDVARRESDEEAGLAIDELYPLTRYWVSPGGTTESIYLFLARVNTAEIDRDGDGLVDGRFGLDHEHEDIRVRVVPIEQALADVEGGRIVAAAPVIALLWLDRLRLQAKL
ncbi:NUDIX domain-containing protein [Guyparkeria halophila]|uniref:ADP-ribose pyrophosphatase n=1 Tax=Guyparkeria halophila TaxID=47960 RepID=A0ABZ0YVX4_9GAMM|nr:NUDIX domain-containing protein [Guyparkeria halophila]WQH15729.1 NUDIX domain-containing protein [Guyparkeria halophila]